VAKKPRTPPPPRPVQAPQRRGAPAARRSLDRRLLWGGLAVLVAIGVGVGLAVGLSGGGSSTAKGIDWGSLPGLQTGPPPWGNDVQNLADRLQPLGLSQLSAEGTVLHIHQYLDLWVNGKRVTLPPNVGIDDNTFITELHVHVGEPNIIHVESPVKKTFHLGQLFGEWGVRLTSRCVGRFCGPLNWWVNGAKQTGNPADLALQEHQVIVIALGKRPPTVPKTYNWAGL
jgi:hypothetical protein